MEKICRLCLDTIKDKCFEIIDDLKKDVLASLLLKLNIDNKREHVMCNVCLVKLLAAYEFKSTCIYTNNTIIPYVDLENEDPVDLRQVYMKENGTEHQESLSDDQKICRLCMQLVTGEFKSAHDVDDDLVQRFIPEVDFCNTKDPVVCKACLNCLRTHSGFVINCHDIQETNKNVCYDEASSENIEIKSEKPDHEEEVFITPEFVEVRLQEDERQSNTRLNSSEEETNDKACKVVTVQPLQIKMYKCDLCKFVCRSQEALSKHEEAKHKNTEPYRCVKCRYQTTYKSYFARHQAKHKEPFKCEKCDFETLNKDAFKKHQVKHQEPLKCEKCAYETVNKDLFNKHQLRHKDSYKCNKCEYETIYKVYFTKHQLKHREPYVCEKCGYETIHREVFNKHQLRHNKESFKCDQCDYETNRKVYFTEHQLKHKDPSEVKVYKCDSCNYKSIHKYLLTRHQLKHQDPSDVQVYKCDKCSFQTTRKDNMSHWCVGV